MASWLWFVLVALLVAGLGWSLRPVRTVGPVDPSRRGSPPTRHAGRVTAAAWTALVAAAACSSPPWSSSGTLSGPSRGLFVGRLPAVAGIAFLAVHAGGELTWPRPAGRRPARRAGPAPHP